MEVFFVIEPKFLKFINGDNTFMEQEPLKNFKKQTISCI